MNWLKRNNTITVLVSLLVLIKALNQKNNLILINEGNYLNINQYVYKYLE